jgi:hypothetical protein
MKPIWAVLPAAQQDPTLPPMVGAYPLDEEV